MFYKFSLQGIRRKAYLGAPVPSFLIGPVDGKQIIFSVDFIQMRTFMSQIDLLPLFRDQPIQSSFPGAGKIGLPLRQPDLGLPIGDIDPAVVIKKQGRVMKIALRALQLFRLQGPPISEAVYR